MRIYPLKENLKDFKIQIEETYHKESKQRFSLEEKIKEITLPSSLFVLLFLEGFLYNLNCAEFAAHGTGVAFRFAGVPDFAGAGAVAWLIACWGFFGIHVWLLARPLGADAADLVPTTGAFALAFVAGLLVVPLAAGAGVREGVLVATLAGSIGAPAALTVSLVSRLVLLGVDLFLAALFGVGGVARTVRHRGVGSARR